MIPYIGDISEADADILETTASDYDNILEFGCGASTQVIAYMASGAFTSVDTSEEWIDKTVQNLALLGIEKQVTFVNYDTFMRQLNNTTLSRKYDMIFVDGVDALRREFAVRLWPHLEVGGVMLFHDTRRAHDFRNVMEVAAQYHNEVEGIMCNLEGSNISAILKKELEPYDNWQITENRQPWQLGYGDVPPEEVEKIKSLIKSQS